MDVLRKLCGNLLIRNAHQMSKVNKKVQIISYFLCGRKNYDVMATRFDVNVSSTMPGDVVVSAVASQQATVPHSKTVSGSTGLLGSFK